MKGQGMLNLVYRLRGRAGETETTSDQADTLTIQPLEQAQGDKQSGEATRTEHPEATGAS